MSRKVFVFLVAIAASIAPLSAWADLYAAATALAKQDLPRAFELYLELAELGHAQSQENIAVMYVNGEGVKRNNVLGYAWAAIAKENGAGEIASGIIAQLEPHLTPAARTRIAEIQAKFGKAALLEHLLPAPITIPVTISERTCRIKSPANPDNFYPVEAKKQFKSGIVLLEATVAPDGRARNARVWHSIPKAMFDEAGLRLAFSNVYGPPEINGAPTSCTIRFSVRFVIEGGDDGGNPEQKRILAGVRENAQAGDPLSQLNYGLALEIRPDMKTGDERSIDWILKSAQAGIVPAQHFVGMHLLGTVVREGEKSEIKGLAWLKMAVDAGQPDAQVSFANYLLRNRPEAETFAKAQALLEKAASSGLRDAKYHLAALLAAGPEAAERDPKRALALLELLQDELDSNPTFFEVRAAANAHLREFVAAQKDQKIAIQKARRLGWDSRDLKSRLATYEASKTWTGNLFAF